MYYGADNARYKQVRTKSGITTTTHYIDKLYEVETTNGVKKHTSYISDVAILSSDEGLKFTFKDRLGSTTTISDQYGNNLTYRNFDPFGKPRQSNGNLSSTSSYGAVLGQYNDNTTRRGFTDHEHLDEVEFIHMNGRVYDYNLGRFLSVDPFIMSPGNSQALNPYSYGMNNPLSGTDPTGYIWETVWDVGNVIYDAGKVVYGAVTGNDAMVSEGLTDMALDAAAAAIPFVPAGASKFTRAGVDKIADVRQASKKTDTSNVQKPDNVSKTDGGSKGNGAESSQSASGSKPESTADIGSQEQISSTRELRGGNFKEGKAEAQNRSSGTCEYCGAQNANEGDHFIPLNEGKKKVNGGEMTKAQAKDTLNKSENIVNSCTSCNRGSGGKGTKMPSKTTGDGKWVPPNPSSHVKDKLDKM